jgi:hypothetical protein
MSNSIAAAKRRRAGVIESTPPPPTPPVSSLSAQQQIPSRLTLPQVISMLDARLAKLESPPIQEQLIEETVSVSEYVVEMDHKFSVLVDEISTLKDIVLKLQSFTMEVNKMLVDERIQMTSEFQAPGDIETVNLEEDTK